MNKQTFEMVKSVLTTHRIYSNETDYSLSLNVYSWDGIKHYSIDVYSNYTLGSFHDGFASFFCKVADICYCSLTFKSINNVCVAHFF